MAQKAADMSGMKIGRLTVISRAENTKQNKAQWLCKCDCGNYVVVPRHSLRRNTYSCGCYRSDWAKEHNKTHGMKKTRLYRIWSGMKDRCRNPKSKYWQMYGGRGITVYQEWSDSFVSFYNWAVSNGYKEDLTIDRIDNNEGYSPDNCRWATYEEQENNRRNNRRIEYNGEVHTIAEWSRIFGIDQRLISQRLYNNWSIERALTQKPKRRTQKCQKN